VGIPIQVVTNNQRAVAEITLANHPIKILLETLISVDDIKNPKPHPEGYQLALERLKVDPDKVLGVEDSRPGVEALLAAEVGKVIHVHRGKNISPSFFRKDDQVLNLQKADQILMT
jgi:HAD superfamily hydrolase (TIGR01509 family)